MNLVFKPNFFLLFWGFWFTISLSHQSISAAPYTVIDVKNGSSIKGMVTLKGKVPKPKEIFISKDPDVCGKGSRIVDQVEISTSIHRGIKNAVVYIDKIDEGKDWKKEIKKPILLQKDCKFLPQLTVIRKNKTLFLRNKDPLIHNVHAQEWLDQDWETLFNHSQTPRINEIPQSIRPENVGGIKVACDIHTFMRSWVFATNNPYYSVTDDNGQFKISEILPGKYTLKVWHPVLGSMKSELNLKPRSEIPVQFEYSN